VPASTLSRQYPQPGSARQFTQPAKAWPAAHGPAADLGLSVAKVAALKATARGAPAAAVVLAADTPAAASFNAGLTPSDGPAATANNISLGHFDRFFQGKDTHLGLHIVAEFFLADFQALDNATALEEAMRVSAKIAGATVLSSHNHRFEPHGVSCVVIVQESNLCIHTWPEYGYAAADFFTCGDTVDPWKAFEYLKDFLKAQKFNCVELKRGSTALIKNSQLLNDRVDQPPTQKGQIFQSEWEPDTDQEIRTGLIGEPLVNTRSAFQKVFIGKNKWWGNVLFIDDCMNVAGRDEFIYHEMIVHVPMMTHPDPRRVLIIGGGDGGSAREVLKHPNLERAVMVDIDATVVESCKKHMPEISQGAFDNPKLELIIGDGIDFVRKAADQSWDVIIVDSTDPSPPGSPNGAGEVLFSADFYENVNRILAKNGVVSTQSMMPMRFSPELYNSSLRNLRHSFGMDKTWLYLLPVDAYLGQQSFGLGFKDGVHPEQLDKARVKQFCKIGKLKYYNYNIHFSAFCLPTYLKQSIGLEPHGT
jgi:spermidine synthase